MARKNANSSPGVWLGLLLVLVARTVAQSTPSEEISKYKGYQKNDENTKDSSMVLSEVGPPPKRWSSHDGQKGKKDTEDLSDGKWIDENSALSKSESYRGSEATLEKSNVDKTTTTMKIRHEHTTLAENVATPTKATIENAKKASETGEVDIPLNKTIESVARIGKITSEKELPVTSFQEFEAAGEDDNFEEHTSSELAEATTPSGKFSGSDREKIPHDSRKNIEATNIQQSDSRDAGNNNTISFVNDTKVNDHFGNNTRKFDENAEIFKHLANHPSSLRIIGVTVGDTDNTTTYSSNSSKAKDRTISITGGNDLSTKEPKNNSYSDVDQSTSDTRSRILPKKSTEKPYPYIKSESKFNDDEFVSDNQNTTVEETLKEVSSYENTIGRKISDETTIVTEPSVLVENSIQQTKPIHPKRSGNPSRVNATLLDIPVTSASWSLTTTVNLASKNGTDVPQSPRTSMSDNESRGEIESDAPQDNPNQSATTERPPAVLSDETENNIETAIEKNNGTFNLTASTPISKKLTERSEVVAAIITESIPKLADTQIPNSTEKIITDSNRSSTGNEIEISNGDSSITPNESNMTKGSTGYPQLQGNFSTSTEIYDAGTANATEKSNSEMETTVSLPRTISMTTESIQETSSEIPPFKSTEARPIEENTTNVTRLETTKTIPETTSSQTTNVEYEFVELTTPGVNSTSSQVDIASSEKINTIVTGFLNETSETTECQETVITDSSIEPNNETTVSTKIATGGDFETPIMSTTMIFDTTTTSEINSEVTTEEDPSKTTSFPISETSFTTVTDDYTDMTLSSASSNDNSSNGRLDITTTEQSYNPEEMTTTTMRLTETEPPSQETTTISNIKVLSSSESTGTSQTLTTVTQRTTVQVQSTPEPPEFTTSGDDVTLFVRVLIEGSWSDICPVLGDLRQFLANLLTAGTDRTILPRNIILHQTQCSAERTRRTTLTPVALYVVDDKGDFDYTMTEILPSLYKNSAFPFPLMIHSVEKLVQTEPNNNAIAVVAVSSVAFICLVLLAGLLFIMRKRQTRFNYGERCRPVSLDAFRVDSVSAYNSVRRKGLTRASKRSYGNPAFEDSSVTPSHPLNFAGLSSFCNDINAITEEFEGIPQVTARMDELPAGSEVKNRYANVAPLPETRVLLQKINNEPLTEYINASYVRGPKNATKYYIACQAPMESTVSDFWRMIWEQQSKVIIMLTDIIENGVEKCVEYIPPSEVTDCHRLYGDYQVTLKKREAKEKYAISTLHLKNLENNTYREVSHIWYLWPTNGVPLNGTGLIAILLEARALQRGAPGPIVVHCSPGTGRTGTLIALDLGIRQYEITRTIDVPRVVYTIRRDRAGAVQTKEQYAFIYKALNLYAAKLAGGALESM